MMIFTHFLRRLFPCCAFCLLAGGALQGAKAPTLFNYEMQKSIERQRNARFGIAAQRIAFFQQNALMYLWHKMSQNESRLPLFYHNTNVGNAISPKAPCSTLFSTTRTTV